ncbi:uncharacterized protein LOC100199496 isoform X2 [Hydra vulgaris]|uniref:Metalloendopeptidase n=1 Tax=Hydra vulgaris TaxID=6087 RepID=A0ABM4CPJ0_HYDVU
MNHLVILFTYFFQTSWMLSDYHLKDEEFKEDSSGNDSAMDTIVKINQQKGHHFLESDIFIENIPEEIKFKYNTPHSKVQKNGASKRGLRRQLEYLWVDRIVPYEITPFLESSRKIIEEAMNQISSVSCIKFIPHSTEKNWIRFKNEGGCYSSIGRSFWRAGHQIISLGNRCLMKGTIMHEIMHSLGFWHEQSRPDRDKHVEIFWENIQDGEEHNFAKYDRGDISSLNNNYDINSIMHYGRTSFSKNGLPTLVAIDDKNKNLGQRDFLSNEDIVQLNQLYNCQDTSDIYSLWSEWSPCNPETFCKKRRQRFCSHKMKKMCPKINQFGVETDIEECSKEQCFKPRDGHWNKWESWSNCSDSCGNGFMKRVRVCDDPEPKYGGKNCTGSEKEINKCFLKPCGLGDDDCLFDEQKLCSWTDRSSDVYKWQRIKGSTPSGNTGPDGDHTSGKGYYLYTEASPPADKGMTANLVSKVFPPVFKRCMKFFYSMHGTGVGALRIYLHEVGDLRNILLWETIGPQGFDWKEGNIILGSQVPYEIIFQSERGESYLGDIGLDDITFPCDPKEKQIKTKSAPTTASSPAIFSTLDTLSASCQIQVKPIGCFAEVPEKPALKLAVIIKNFENHVTFPSSENVEESIDSLLCDCLVTAKEKNIRYIGLQNMAECWGTNEDNYSKFGPSTLCLDKELKPCYHSNTNNVCVGKARTNYVYELV